MCVCAHAHACTCVLSANDVLQSAGAFPALQQMPADYPRCFFDKAEILSLAVRVPACVRVQRGGKIPTVRGGPNREDKSLEKGEG